MTSCSNAHQDLYGSVVGASNDNRQTKTIKNSKRGQQNFADNPFHNSTMPRKHIVQTDIVQMIWIECAMRISQNKAAYLHDTGAQFQNTRRQLWQSWYLLFKSRPCVEAQSGSLTGNQRQRNSVVLTCRSFWRCCLVSVGPAVVPP
jgi:hypothetical protein